MPRTCTAHLAVTGVAAIAATAAIVLAAALGCARPAPPPAASEGAGAVAAAPVAAATPSAPVQGGPHSGGMGERALSEEGQTVTTPTFRFELPAKWRRERPSSGMRLAQAVVSGDAGPGELAVYHFGAGQGGGVDSNFERWLGQIEAAPGAAAPVRGELTPAGFKVSWIDARGTLLPSTMGSGPTTPQPGFRLFGAVVEGEGGPWFFKVTGPDATLAAERDAFLALLGGVSRP